MSDYREALKIDLDHLDENWKDHAEHYMEWAEKWSEAVADRDRKKDEVEVVKAELDKEYRIKLENEIGKKPTENMVSMAIIADERYQKVQGELIDKTKDANLYLSAKTAFEHRKKALEGETSLWINGYHSEPKISSAVKDKYKLDEKEEERKQEQKTLKKNPRLKRIKKK